MRSLSLSITQKHRIKTLATQAAKGELSGFFTFRQEGKPIQLAARVFVRLPSGFVKRKRFVILTCSRDDYSRSVLENQAIHLFDNHYKLEKDRLKALAEARS